jgi:hypothetical protein
MYYIYVESELHSRLNPIGGRTINRNRGFRKHILRQYCVEEVQITDLHREILYLSCGECSRRHSERRVCRTP